MEGETAVGLKQSGNELYGKGLYLEALFDYEIALSLLTDGDKKMEEKSRPEGNQCGAKNISQTDEPCRKDSLKNGKTYAQNRKNDWENRKNDAQNTKNYAENIENNADNRKNNTENKKNDRQIEEVFVQNGLHDAQTGGPTEDRRNDEKKAQITFDKYNKKYKDKYDEKYKDKYDKKYDEKYKEKYEEKDSEKFKGNDNEKYKEKYVEKYKEKHDEKYKEKYDEKDKEKYNEICEKKLTLDLLSNIALSELKLERYIPAIETCNKIIKLKYDHQKAYFTKSSALRSLLKKSETNISNKENGRGESPNLPENRNPNNNLSKFLNMDKLDSEINKSLRQIYHQTLQTLKLLGNTPAQLKLTNVQEEKKQSLMRSVAGYGDSAAKAYRDLDENRCEEFRRRERLLDEQMPLKIENYDKLYNQNPEKNPEQNSEQNSEKNSEKSSEKNGQKKWEKNSEKNPGINYEKNEQKNSGQIREKINTQKYIQNSGILHSVDADFSTDIGEHLLASMVAGLRGRGVAVARCGLDSRTLGSAISECRELFEDNKFTPPPPPASPLDSTYKIRSDYTVFQRALEENRRCESIQEILNLLRSFASSLATSINAQTGSHLQGITEIELCHFPGHGSKHTLHMEKGEAGMVGRKEKKLESKIAFTCLYVLAPKNWQPEQDGGWLKFTIPPNIEKGPRTLYEALDIEQEVIVAPLADSLLVIKAPTIWWEVTAVKRKDISMFMFHLTEKTS